ncbi:GntR family transcriptional regulator [Amycolatopsis anabasis]|uniref:GntR family transcriptional regulator n=1 Tax=Amycolatopsis anabasis TaxID=1840409 RepID=UPI00131D63EB|nr:GntR family transcriptional regulator [Amycolatopsis anabasis]
MQQITDHIREQIASGRLVPGAKLPSTRELLDEWGVSEATVLKAIGQLRAEGRVVTHQGLGVYVPNQQVLPHFASNLLRPWSMQTAWDRFEANAEAAGRKPGKRFTKRVKVAPEDIAERLGVPTRAKVVQRIVEYRVDNEPWSIQIGYYPLDLAKELGLDVDHDVPGGTRQILEKAGHADASRIDEWIARAPTSEEAAQLEMTAGVKLLVKTSTIASNSRITRVMRDLLPDDRNVVIYEQGDDKALDIIRATRPGGRL